MKNLLIPLFAIALFFTACTKDDSESHNEEECETCIEEECKACYQNRIVEIEGEIISEDIVNDYGTLCGTDLDDIENQESDISSNTVGGFTTVITITTICN